MSEDFTARRYATLREGLDLARLRGMEIGPLDAPIVAKADGDVTYVDIADAAALREKYAGQVPTERIVEVDAIWGERSLAECAGAGCFDYVIASHVAEHVPDLVTWLGEVEAVLRPTGELRLAMPDCRFSFDAKRDETRLIDVLGNYVMRARRPTPANVLDFRLHFAPDIDGIGRYEGRAGPDDVAPCHSFQLALETAGWARDLPDRYFDVHCWVFQPRSFARVMARLAEEGLVRFACARLIDPSLPLLEFYAFLRPCADAAAASASWRMAAEAAADLLGDREPPEVARLREALMAAQREIALLRGSTSWRAMAPVRWAAARIRR